jgi:hypothetical protein
MNEAETLIRREMLGLLQHDAFSHPVVVDQAEVEGKKSKKKKKRKVAEEATLVPPPEQPLDYIPEEKLDEAKVLLEREAETAFAEKTNELRSSGDAYVSMSDESIKDALAAKNAEAALQEASAQTFGEQGWHSAATNGDDLAALKLEYEALREVANATKKKADKLETKIGIKNGGYIKRAAALREAAAQTFAETQHAKIEESVYRLLMSHERRGITSRAEKLEKEIAVLEKSEAAAQKRYGDLMHTKHRLLNKIRQKQME